MAAIRKLVFEEKKYTLSRSAMRCWPTLKVTKRCAATA